MHLKKPIRASIDQVRITRQGTTAIIEFADETIGGVNLTIGEKIHGMTDQDILELHNDIISAQEQSLRDWDNTVIEIPPGKPQIKFSRDSGPWVPQGEVLRCIIHDNESPRAGDRDRWQGAGAERVWAHARSLCRLGHAHRFRPRGAGPRTTEDQGSPTESEAEGVSRLNGIDARCRGRTRARTSARQCVVSTTAYASIMDPWQHRPEGTRHDRHC